MSAERPGHETGRRGRRPSGSTGRQPILDVAAAQFAAYGYQAATVRRIAQAAGVDAKLVHYYFGSKEDLFSAAIADAFNKRGIGSFLSDHNEANGTSKGTLFLQGILAALEDPGIGPAFVGLVRNLGTHDESRRIFMRFVSDEILDRLATRIDVQDPEVRVALIGSQILGLVTARYVLEVPPLVKMPASEVARLVGPVIDYYLTSGTPEQADPTLP